ncbi:hypothetical protein QL093DRAFT_2185108 [Fusarium oxysporum]|nr:hypothetical protein QL093DRAFT_2185108 [Fusarium oxysporum]
MISIFFFTTLFRLLRWESSSQASPNLRRVISAYRDHDRMHIFLKRRFSASLVSDSRSPTARATRPLNITCPKQIYSSLFRYRYAYRDRGSSTPAR